MGYELEPRKKERLIIVHYTGVLSKDEQEKGLKETVELLKMDVGINVVIYDDLSTKLVFPTHLTNLFTEMGKMLKMRNGGILIATKNGGWHSKMVLGLLERIKVLSKVVPTLEEALHWLAAERKKGTESKIA